MTATAARSSLLVTAFSIRSHTISKLIPGSTSLISSSTLTAAASLLALRDTRGYRRSFSSLDSRSALDNNSVVITRSNSSKASSVARADNASTVATSTARRCSRDIRRSRVVLPAMPCVASPSNRRGGTVDTSSAPAPTATRSATLFSAATMPFDDGRNRPFRRRSSSLTRCLPASGTSNSRSNALEVCGVSGDVNCCHNR